MASIEVSETSVEGQNIQQAINFVRAMGQTAQADNILKWMRDGKISHDRDLKENGETSAYTGNITIADQVIQYGVGNAKQRETLMDPKRDFAAIAALARTLLHEKVHAHQSFWTHYWGTMPGKSGHEIEAWGKTIDYLDEWVEVLKKQRDALPVGSPERDEAFKKLKVVVDMKVTYISDCIDSGHYTDKQGLTEHSNQLKAWIAQEEQGVATPPPAATFAAPGSTGIPMKAAGGAIAAGVLLVGTTYVLNAHPAAAPGGPSTHPSPTPAIAAPHVSPITATFERPVTSYELSVTGPNASSATYTWEKNGSPCGSFIANGDQARWSHPDKDLGGDCPSEAVHPALIKVTIDVPSWRCVVEYPYGSKAGTGPDSQPCTPRS